jgi:hypothetical protein
MSQRRANIEFVFESAQAAKTWLLLKKEKMVDASSPRRPQFLSQGSKNPVESYPNDNRKSVVFH